MTQSTVIPFGLLKPVVQTNVVNHWPNGHTVIMSGLVVELLSRNANKATMTFKIVGVVKPPEKK